MAEPDFYSLLDGRKTWLRNKKQGVFLISHASAFLILISLLFYSYSSLPAILCPSYAFKKTLRTIYENYPDILMDRGFGDSSHHLLLRDGVRLEFIDESKAVGKGKRCSNRLGY